jgi:8-oxo-dGTP pyrophosphatase MutT (NUDIX family)
MPKTVLAAGGVVLNQNNELLMICKRSKWDLPKGHVDKKETFEACALREVREETGLKNLSIVRYLGFTAHEYYDHELQSDAVKETHWFLMKGDKKESLNAQMTESIEWIRWVSKSELEKCLRNSFLNVIEILNKAELI